MSIIVLTSIGVETILGMVASYGIFPLLFGYLLFYTIKANREREQEMQNTMREINSNMITCIRKTQDDVQDIKEDVAIVKIDVGQVKNKVEMYSRFHDKQ